MEYLPGNITQSPSLLRKLATMVVALLLLGLALVFSVLVLAAVFVAGAIAMGYFWWRTREQRRQLRDHPPGGTVIEGEVIQSENVEVEVKKNKAIRGNVEDRN